MATFRFPGPLCVTAALPLDSGTLVRATTSPPGPLRTNSESASLSDADGDLIQKFAGRDVDGPPFPLELLRRSYDQHFRRHQEAVREVGAQSWRAVFEQATAERLAELIREAQSPRGKAVEKLRKLLEPPEGTDEQLQEAIAELLAAEGEIQRRRLPDTTGLSERERIAVWLREPAAPVDSTSQYAMALVEQARHVMAKRQGAKLKSIVEKAKRAGSTVTEQLEQRRQLKEALQGTLARKRQDEILGGAGNPSTDALMDEAVELGRKLLKNVLKDLIANATRPGMTLTDKQIGQLKEVAAEMLSDERGRQLLGSADDSPDRDAMALHDEVAEILRKYGK